MEDLIRYLKSCNRYKLKSIKIKYLNDEIQEILHKYNLTLYELCYRIQHNIPFIKIFKCKYCGKIVGLRGSNGYKKFCNIKCATKFSNKLNVVKDKKKKTCLKKYGVDNPLKSDACRDKAKNTMLKIYGVDSYAKTKEYKNLVIKNKDEIHFKMKQTCLKKYGVDNYTKTKEYLVKQYRTKKKNKTFNISNEEDLCYKLFVSRFSKNDIIRQYKSDLYPFSCDFYIKSLDLYIEYNGHWTHGWDNGKLLGYFNKDDLEHIQVLQNWRLKNTKYYQNAIEVWTVKDPLKYKIAKENKLNYKVFWNIEEVETWIKDQGLCYVR